MISTAGIAIGVMGLPNHMHLLSVLTKELSMAVIRIRSHGNDHIDKWCSLKDSRNVFLKTIYDVDEQFFPERSKKVEDAHGTKPLTV